MSIAFGLVFTLVSVYYAAAIAVPLETTLFKNAVEAEERIVGGSPAQRNQFPYQVSYQFYNRHFCGGSILTAQWVLTAAHCIKEHASDARVVAGMLNREEAHPDVQIASVAEQIPHRSYSGRPYHHCDIALLRLATPLRFTNAVQPISLPRSNSYTGAITLSGWGQLHHENENLPTTLQYIRMNLLSAEECARRTGREQGVVLCTHGNKQAGACFGDSGGPMVQNGQVIGVASVVDRCGQLSAYTTVSKYITWIKQYVPA